MDNQTVIIDDKTRSKDRLNGLLMSLEKTKTDPYNKPEILIAKRQETTKYGSDYFTFHIVNEKGYLIDITMDIANVIGVKLNKKMDGTIYRKFGNMDMGFQTLYEMFSSLGNDIWKDWQTRIRYRYI